MKPASALKNESVRSQEIILEFAEVARIAAEKITGLEAEIKNLKIQLLTAEIMRMQLELNFLETIPKP